MVNRCEREILDPRPELCDVVFRVYVVDHLRELLVVAPVLQARFERGGNCPYLEGHVPRALAVGSHRRLPCRDRAGVSESPDLCALQLAH